MQLLFLSSLEHPAQTLTGPSSDFGIELPATLRAILLAGRFRMG
jgi:hypothetical protein